MKVNKVTNEEIGHGESVKDHWWTETEIMDCLRTANHERVAPEALFSGVSGEDARSPTSAGRAYACFGVPGGA